MIRHRSRPPRCTHGHACLDLGTPNRSRRPTRRAERCCVRGKMVLQPCNHGSGPCNARAMRRGRTIRPSRPGSPHGARPKVGVLEKSRAQHGAGQRVGGGPLRPYLRATHEADLSPVTRWRTLQRWGFTAGPGTRRSALHAREAVVRTRRRSRRQTRANRHPDGRLTRPAGYPAETFVTTHHSRPLTSDLEEDGPWVNTPSAKGPRLISVQAMTVTGWV